MDVNKEKYTLYDGLNEAFELATIRHSKYDTEKIGEVSVPITDWPGWEYAAKKLGLSELAPETDFTQVLRKCFRYLAEVEKQIMKNQKIDMDVIVDDLESILAEHEQSPPLKPPMQEKPEAIPMIAGERRHKRNKRSEALYNVRVPGQEDRWMTKQQIRKEYSNYFKIIMESWDKVAEVQDSGEDANDTVTLTANMSDAVIDIANDDDIDDAVQVKPEPPLEQRKKTPRKQRHDDDIPEGSIVLGSSGKKKQKVPLDQVPDELFSTPPVILPSVEKIEPITRDQLLQGQSEMGRGKSSLDQPIPAPIYNHHKPLKEVPTLHPLHASKHGLVETMSPAAMYLNKIRKNQNIDLKPKARKSHQGTFDTGPSVVNKIVEALNETLAQEGRFKEEIQNAYKMAEEWETLAMELMRQQNFSKDARGYVHGEQYELNPEEIKSLIQKQKSNDERMEMLLQDLHKHEKYLMEADEEIKRLENEKLALQNEIKEASNQQNDSSLRIKELERKVNDLKEQLLVETKRYNEAFNEMSWYKALYEEAISENKKIVTALQGEMEKLEGFKSHSKWQLEKQTEALQRHATILGKELQEQKSVAEALQKSLSDKEEQLSKQAGAHMRTVAELKAELARLKATDKESAEESGRDAVMQAGLSMQALARQTLNEIQEERQRLEKEKEIMMTFFGDFNYTMEKGQETDPRLQHLMPEHWKNATILKGNLKNDNKTVELTVGFPGDVRFTFTSPELQARPHCIKSLVGFYESMISIRRSTTPLQTKPKSVPPTLKEEQTG